MAQTAIAILNETIDDTPECILQLIECYLRGKCRSAGIFGNFGVRSAEENYRLNLLVVTDFLTDRFRLHAALLVLRAELASLWRLTLLPIVVPVAEWKGYGGLSMLDREFRNSVREEYLSIIGADVGA